MTIETLHIIQKLLKKRFRKAKRKVRIAEENVTLAFKRLEEIENNPGSGSAELDVAKANIVAVKIELRDRRRKLAEAKTAMDDLTNHDWR